LAGAGLSTLLGLPVTYVFVTVLYLAGLALTLGVARRLSRAAARRAPGARAHAVGRAEGRPALRAAHAPPPRPDVARVPHQPDRLSRLRRAPTLPGPERLSRRRHRPPLAGAELRPGRPPRVDDHGHHRRMAAAGARDPRLHRGVVRAAAGLRPPAERGPRAPAAARGRLRAERGDDLDDRHPDHRRGRSLPRAGDGSADPGGLRPATRPHGLD